MSDRENVYADMLIQACQKLHEADGMIEALGRPDLAREFGSLAASLRQTMFDLEDMDRSRKGRVILGRWTFTATFPLAALYVVLAWAVSLGDAAYSRDVWHAWKTARRGLA